MTLLVDTSVWSLPFRRDAVSNGPQVGASRAALEGEDSIVATGLVLQELLQGFTGPAPARTASIGSAPCRFWLQTGAIT